MESDADTQAIRSQLHTSVTRGPSPAQAGTGNCFRTKAPNILGAHYKDSPGIDEVRISHPHKSFVGERVIKI